MYLFLAFLFLATDHVFKWHHDILVSGLHEEYDLVMLAIEKELFSKAVLYPSERALTVVTAYYK